MTPDLPALVGSRICHDLISPIGAIGNGVELMSLTDDNSDQEIALITESVENANARIRFFRIAFGAASSDQMINRAEVVSVLTATAIGGRFDYTWEIEDQQPRSNVRAAFLAIQCLETALPAGGDITIKHSDGKWDVTATGPRFKIEHPLWDALGTPDMGHAFTAATVQFALLPQVTKAAGRILDAAHFDDRITISY
jgi:histidine phosphotransferase ChpT